MLNIKKENEMSTIVLTLSKVTLILSLETIFCLVDEKKDRQNAASAAVSQN